MKRFLLITALLIGSVSLAFGQSPVVTQPKPVNTGTYSSTIISTNTFQSVLAASTSTTGRVGCLVQNNGSNKMYVFFGPIASALTTNSVQLNAGQTVNCESVGGSVLRDQVSITGTSGDRFYASQY